MADIWFLDKGTVQNLKDEGCVDEFIESYLKSSQNERRRIYAYEEV